MEEVGIPLNEPHARLARTEGISIPDFRNVILILLFELKNRYGVAFGITKASLLQCIRDLIFIQNDRPITMTTNVIMVYKNKEN